MKKVFVAYSFREENDQLFKVVERLVKSHGFQADTGEVLGGDSLTIGVKQKISDSDALIAVLSKDKKADGSEQWFATDWVKSELQSARNSNKSCIALVESGVSVDGLYAEYERINFDRNNLLTPLLRLSETLFFWRDNAGRSVKIKLEPKEAAELALSHGKCYYRVGRVDQPLGDAKEIWIDDYDNDLYIISLAGIREDHEVQIEIREGDSIRWRSKRMRQFIYAQLKPA